MPALVRSRVWSPTGIREELGIILWPFSSKNSRNAERISSLFTEKLQIRAVNTYL